MNWKIGFIFGLGTSFLTSALLGFLTTNQFADLFQTLAAVSATLIAYMGLTAGIDTWKDQHKIKKAEELAKKCLYLIYKLRDDLENVRHPFISIGEMESSIKKVGLEAEKINDTDSVNRAVYSERWKSVINTRNELMSYLLEVEVEWGFQAKSKIFTINQQVTELFSQINLFLEARKDRLHDMEILYGTGAGNKFTKEINSSVEIAENFLREKIII